MAVPALSLIHTDHAQLRETERSFLSRAVEYVVQHGTLVHRTGIEFYILRDDDLPHADRRNDTIARLRGTVVLVGRNGAVITLYRGGPKALRNIVKKQRFARSA